MQDYGVCILYCIEFNWRSDTLGVFLWGVRPVCLLLCRCESVGGDREWFVAAGPKWSGEGVLPHQQTKVSADGCTGRTQCSHHYIRYMY